MGLFRMTMEEEEEDDDAMMLVQGCVMAADLERASSSRRRRAEDAPPRQLKQRDREYGDARIRADYFGSSPVYSAEMFRRR